MSEPVLLVEHLDRVVILTLNRPQVRNALSKELRQSLAAEFETLTSDPETGVVILTGAGSAFSAGLDLKELAEEGLGDFGNPAGEGRLMSVLENLDRPLIGAVNGPALTGGFELALACDILIASTNASFADTHARVGILPGWGLSQKLARIIGPGRAREMSFTGNPIAAEQAERWGLVNRVVEPEDLRTVCLDLARDMLSCLPETISAYKKLINRGFSLSLAQGLDLERQTFNDWYEKDLPGKGPGGKKPGRSL